MTDFVKMVPFVGSRFGVPGPVVLCRWKLKPESLVRLSLAQIDHLQKQAQQLWPADPLPFMGKESWPRDLVQESQPESRAHWAVGLTVALLRLAREPASPARVVTLQGGHAWVAFSCIRSSILKQAMVLAWELLGSWLNEPQNDSSNGPSVLHRLSEWLASVQPGGLAPNTLRFALAAHAQQIPVSWVAGTLRLGWGANAELLDSSFTGRTSNLATRNARIKSVTHVMLTQALVPVPAQRVIATAEQALEFVEKVGWPVVIKPSNQDQGNGVVPGICNEVQLRRAFDAASVYSPRQVIVEAHVSGCDYRLLVVGGKLLIATQRIPAGVVGDGHSSVVDLIEKANADARRGTDKRSLMKRLVLDEDAVECLSMQGLTGASIPAARMKVNLRRIANISTGGTAEDVTEQVHPDNVLVAERAARALGLDIAGVDFLCPDISKSWQEVGGAVCEVNAQPGFRPHWLSLPDRDVNAEVVKWLYRSKSPRIPTAAVTGTNGKTTVCRMLHHIWCEMGAVAGVCTTQGVWVGRDQISKRNLSGYPGGRVLLEDPTCESAVIELPRKGLVKFGQPCDRYDVAALLNVQNDHIGVDGIETLEQMGRLKSQVLELAKEAVVLNANDAVCLAMREGSRWGNRVILVARQKGSAPVVEHLAHGAEAVYLDILQGEKWVVLAHGEAQSPVMPVSEISAAMHGLLTVNVTNAMFAVAVAYAQGLPLSHIRGSLQTFKNTIDGNIGRYNFIDGLPYKVLLDYGHNPEGVRELSRVIKEQSVTGQKRLLSLKIGNRHKTHFPEIADALKNTFDSFVLGCDADYIAENGDYAGEDPAANMLAASKNALRQAGVADQAITIERNYQKAIHLAFEGARPGDLLVLLAEPNEVLPILKMRLSLV